MMRTVRLLIAMLALSGVAPIAVGGTTLQSPHSGAGSYFGFTIVSVRSGFAIFALGEHVIYYYDLGTGTFENSLPYGLGFEPQAEMAAVGSNLVVVSGANVLLVDPTDSAVLQTFTLPAGSPGHVAGYGDEVYVSSDGGRAVYVFDATTGALARTINAPPSVADFGLNSLTQVANFLAVSNTCYGSCLGRAYLFDRISGNVHLALRAPATSTFFSTSMVKLGNKFLVGYDGGAYLVDPYLGTLIANIPMGQSPTMAPMGSNALLADANTLKVVGGSGSVLATQPFEGGVMAGNAGVVATGSPFVTVNGMANAGVVDLSTLFVCGNGTREPGEECDDGNLADGDGCDSNCTLPACGNGVLDTGEECDPAASDAPLGCTSACTVCGNGTRTSPEQCDDGNLVDGDGCDSNCTFTACGNRVLDPGEECDDGNHVNADGCEADCTLSGCGNGILDPLEECDDGNTVDGDGCDSNCTVTRCGNGIVDPGEQCDVGNTGGCGGCSPTCQLESCGNGVVDCGEQCDDGNNVNGDSCEADCTLSRCGNGLVDAGEECDDGNRNGSDGCTNACTVCGNGAVTSPEQCDDGNLVDGDDCDSNCTSTGCRNGIVTAGEQCDDGNAIDYDGCSSSCVPQYADLSGSWQLTVRQTANYVGTAPLSISQGPSASTFEVSPGFDCGAEVVGGQIHRISDCPSTPVPGSMQGSTISFSSFSDAIYDTPFSVGSCPAVSRVTESVTIVGTISNVGQPTANRIAGTVTYNSIVLYDASSNVCLTLSGAAFPFVMRRADVPAGSNVSAEPFDDGTVSFETVNTAGAAAIVTVTDATGTLPTNFQLSNSLYVDVVTSADHAGTITTCLPYPDADDDGFVDGTNPPLPEGQLQILHAENGVFVDRTISRDPVNNVICAETSSLSEFAVGAGSTTTTTSTTSSTTTTTIPAGCDSTPRGTCRTANPAGSKVGIKDRTPNTADQVSWKWKGQATTLGDFGNPPSTTGYAVCVYQGATLKLAARAPASGACGMKPCWKALGTNGYGYKDGALTPDGLSKVTLKAGAMGRAQVAVKGKGANLPDGVLPLTTPVTIQLQATTGECWGATFGTAAVSDTGQFKATSD